MSLAKLLLAAAWLEARNALRSAGKYIASAIRGELPPSEEPGVPWPYSAVAHKEAQIKAAARPFEDAPNIPLERRRASRDGEVVLPPPTKRSR